MFSPKELEGEVDHSFFDSDGEAEKVVHQNPEEPDTPGERVEKANEKRDSKESVLKGKTLEGDLSGLRIRGESGHHSEETNAVKERKGAESGKEDSGPSSRKSSSLPCSDRLESRHDSQSDDSSSVRSYSSVEPDSDSSGEEGDDDAVLKNDDGSDESDEKDKRQERPLPKRHSEISTRCPGQFRNRSRSQSSSSESSHSSDGQSSASLHKPPLTQTTPSPRRRPRPSSASQRERAKVAETAESEDTVTDVTPLSSPDISPGQLFDLTLLTEPTRAVAGQQKDVAVEEPSVTEVDSEKRRSSDTDGEVRSAVLSAGRRVDSALVICSPSSASSSSCSGRPQRNYSFNSEEVRRIERENERLLRELSRPSRSSARSRSGFSTHSTSAAHLGGPPTARLYHSALNRQRQQQRIQQENLAFLKRLESVKPTPGMTRAEQLADYQRQAGYLGIPAPLSRPSSGRGSRPCSTNSQKARPETAKPSRSTAPRPAWS